jgi:arylsulfatase A-like enzyme
MSDHGELLGDHGMYLKGPHFYEGAVHVPLIISWPGRIAPGKRSSALVELVDLAPTLLEAAGVPVYPGMQGRSLQPLLQGDAVHHRDDVYCEVDETAAGKKPGYAIMIRSEAHKLTIYHSAGEGELYDLQSDPLESRNLWNDPAELSLKLHMMEQLCRRMAEQADPLPPRIAPW